jgi:hypothetical protein
MLSNSSLLILSVLNWGSEAISDGLGSGSTLNMLVPAEMVLDAKLA